jgi:hypothetical protein
VLNKSTRGASPACLSRTSVFLLTSFLSFPSSGIISARRVYAFLSLYVDTYALTLCAGLGLCCGAHFALSRPPSRAPTHTVLHTRRKDRGRITCVSPPASPSFFFQPFRPSASCVVHALSASSECVLAHRCALRPYCRTPRADGRSPVVRALRCALLRQLCTRPVCATPPPMCRQTWLKIFATSSGTIA